MKEIVKRELFVFFVLFVLLALSVHYKEWFSHPLEQLAALPHSQFGVFHPLIFTFILYILVGVVRIVIAFVKKIKAKRAG